MAKIEIVYRDTSLDLAAADVLDSESGEKLIERFKAGAEVSASDVRRAISDTAGEILADREWPSFQVRGDKDLVDDVTELAISRAKGG